MWDRAKAAVNLRVHGVAFEDAIPAIEDSQRLESLDDRFDYGEERTILLGLSRNRILFVVVTQRGEQTCRIISARKATRDEEDRYYAGDREIW